MFSSNKNLFKKMVVLLFILASMNIFALEKKKDAPLSISGTAKVTAEEIFSLIDKLPNLLIIDARIASDRIQGYLQNSISLPDVKTNCASLKKVIKKKSSPILFYCNGVKCGRSGKAAKVALKCGYNNIYWFRGGFEEWKSKNLPFVKK